MSTQKMKSRVSESSRSAVDESASEEVRDRLAGLLPADALQDALAGLRPEEITGPGGLVTQLAGRVLETALGAELTEHLGYPPGQAPPGGAGNARNGSTPKTLLTEHGDVRIAVPRPQGQLRAADRRQEPAPPGGPGREDRRALRRRDDHARDRDLHLRALRAWRRPRHRQPRHRRRARGRQGLADPAAGGGLPDPLPRRSRREDPRR